MALKSMGRRICSCSISLWSIALILLVITVVGIFAQSGAGAGASRGGNGPTLSSSSSSSSRMRQKAELIELQDDNWQLMLKGEWMVEFFAPWCPACKNLAPTWERFAITAGDVKVNVAKIDVTTSPSLSGRFFVTALPTIYHVKDGEFRQYRGSRDGDALMLFVKQKQWQKLEPISAWKKPDTIHMSILSYFFKLSHTLKDFNARLQEEYGLPTWGSYALFAVGTIFVGAALGLLLVCVVDFLYPPKKSQRQSFSEAKEKSLHGVEDLANDEIEDDDDEVPLLIGKTQERDNETKDGAGDNVEEDDDDDENENDDDEAEVQEGSDEAEEDDDASTSDGEKNSHSENDDEPESAKTKGGEGDTKIKESTATSDKPSTSDVRKRKPRKAD